MPVSYRSTALTIRLQDFSYKDPFKGLVFFLNQNHNIRTPSFHKPLCTHPAAKTPPFCAYLVLSVGIHAIKGENCQQAQCLGVHWACTRQGSWVWRTPRFPEGNKSCLEVALGRSAANDTLVSLVNDLVKHEANITWG